MNGTFFWQKKQRVTCRVQAGGGQTVLWFWLRLPGQGGGSGEREAHPRRRTDLGFWRQLRPCCLCFPPRAGGSGVLSPEWGGVGPALWVERGRGEVDRVSGGAPGARGCGVSASGAPRVVHCREGGRWSVAAAGAAFAGRAGADGRSSRALCVGGGGVGPGGEPRSHPNFRNAGGSARLTLRHATPAAPLTPACWGLRIYSCSRAAPYARAGDALPRTLVSHGGSLECALGTGLGVFSRPALRLSSRHCPACGSGPALRDLRLALSGLQGWASAPLTLAAILVSFPWSPLQSRPPTRDL